MEQRAASRQKYGHGDGDGSGSGDADADGVGVAGRQKAKQAPQQRPTKFISPHNLTTFRRNNRRTAHTGRRTHRTQAPSVLAA